MVKLFDAHCHLQDPRIFSKTPELIKTAVESGVVYFTVNGIKEEDWELVKEMCETFPSVVPSFGLHPWFVADRSPNWFEKLKELLNATPSAAVGEIGLDKGQLGSEIDFSDQAQVLRQQLELAKELNRPASVHCVNAFEDLLHIMRSIGPFPAGVVLHSYIGSAEMVPEFSKLGAYFSFSGHNMSQPNKTKTVLKTVPSDRILLETDAPDALPKSNTNSLSFVQGDPSLPEEFHDQGRTSCSIASISMSNSSQAVVDTLMLPKGTLNHPANIHIVLDYVASLLEITKEEFAELSYQNALCLFSYEGSKVPQEN